MSVITRSSFIKWREALVLLLVIMLNPGVIAQEDDHEEDDHDDHDDAGKPWGMVILGTQLVNLVTLIGVIFFIPKLRRSILDTSTSKTSTADAVIIKNTTTQDEESIVATTDLSKVPTDLSNVPTKVVDILIPSFAAGALLATAFFLVIPEAISLLSQTNSHETSERSESDHHEEEGHEDDEDLIPVSSIWRFGVSILAGFLLPFVFGVVFPKTLQLQQHECDDNCIVDGVPPEEEEIGSCCNKAVDCVLPNASVSDETRPGQLVVKGKEEPPSVDWSLALSILVGDALHNFCDGVFIGVSFMVCGYSTSFSIIGITIYHEIAQELSDYLLLTRHARVKPCQALLLNFLSGLSVTLGGLIVFAVDVTDGRWIGVVLSLAAGVYLHIAACECLPRVEDVLQTRKDRFVSMGMFLLGCLPIGLTLLNHKHCDAH